MKGILIIILALLMGSCAEEFDGVIVSVDDNVSSWFECTEGTKTMVRLQDNKVVRVCQILGKPGDKVRIVRKGHNFFPY